MKALYPNAAILVHPESPQTVIELAAAVGLTSQLIQAVKRLPNKLLIVVTKCVFFTRCSRLARIKSCLRRRAVKERAAAIVRIARKWRRTA